MAKKQDIGEMVASSMKEILESESHQLLFNKTAAKKKCCACDEKCARKCPCKTNGGCKKNCGPCDSMDKKASSLEEKEEKKKCCDCVGSCGEKCPCSEKEEASCSECATCNDGMMSAKSSLDMVKNLLVMSEQLDMLGLHDSASNSLKAAKSLIDELRKNAQLNLDENDASELDSLFPEEDESFELSPESETPKLDNALKELLEKHPDFADQFGRRMKEKTHSDDSESLEDVIRSMREVGSEGADLEDFLPKETMFDGLSMSETIPAEFDPSLTYPDQLKPADMDDVLADEEEEYPTLPVLSAEFDSLLNKFAFGSEDFEDESDSSSDIDAMMDELLSSSDNSLANDRPKKRQSEEDMLESFHEFSDWLNEEDGNSESEEEYDGELYDDFDRREEESLVDAYLAGL